MDYDRGRVYGCTACSFVGEKRAAIKHFSAKHFQANDYAYQCDLCMFSNNQLSMMKRHSTFYSPHAVAKALAIRHQSYKGTDGAHIIQNSQVRDVNIEQDIVRWSAEDSKLYWTSRRRQTPTAVPKVVIPPSATSVTVQPSATSVLPSATSIPQSTTYTITTEAIVEVPVTETASYTTYSIPSTDATTSTTCITLPSALQDLINTVPINLTQPDVISPSISLCSASDVTPSTSVSDNRIIVNTSDFQDRILELSEAPTSTSPPSPFIPKFPSPLKPHEYKLPKPSLPDIQIPKLQSVSENILDQILPNEHYEHFDTEDVPSLKDAFCELAESVSKTNSLLENMNKLLQQNNDNIQKVERAVRVSACQCRCSPDRSRPRSTSTFRRPPNYSRPTISNDRRNQPMRKRSFVPEKTVSPMKKMKSSIQKKSPQKKFPQKKYRK